MLVTILKFISALPSLINHVIKFIAVIRDYQRASKMRKLREDISNDKTENVEQALADSSSPSRPSGIGELRERRARD